MSDAETADQVIDEPEAAPAPEPVAEAPAPAGGRLFTGPTEDGIATPQEQNDAYIAAMTRELTGYQQRLAGEFDPIKRQKLEARVTHVEELLVAAGVELVERATEDKPKTSRGAKK